MDNFNQTLTICGNQESTITTTTTSSQSDACSCCITKGSAGSHSDEEVLILATNRPKRKAGRRKFKETRHPVYRGIRKRNGNKWVCELREPNKKSRIWLGTYPTPEMAARAHDVAALAFRGKSACLNFADSCWKLRVPASGDAIEIRRAASEAAELFRPQESEDRPQESQTESVVDSSEACSESKENESLLFIDEEAIFDMPRLLVDMAEGLLLYPPHFEENAITDWNCLDSDFDHVSLWSH